MVRMLGHEGNTVFFARVDGEIVGMLTLVMVPIPSGLRARIEDVVVDSSARGRGSGNRAHSCSHGDRAGSERQNP